MPILGNFLRSTPYWECRSSLCTIPFQPSSLHRSTTRRATPLISCLAETRRIPSRRETPPGSTPSRPNSYASTSSPHHREAGATLLGRMACTPSAYVFAWSSSFAVTRRVPQLREPRPSVAAGTLLLLSGDVRDVTTTSARQRALLVANACTCSRGSACRRTRRRIGLRVRSPRRRSVPPLTVPPSRRAMDLRTSRNPRSCAFSRCSMLCKPRRSLGHFLGASRESISPAS